MEFFISRQRLFSIVNTISAFHDSQMPLIMRYTSISEVLQCQKIANTDFLVRHPPILRDVSVEENVHFRIKEMRYYLQY